MKKSESLSRHEELRLDYLYQNIHFLNPREREEYEYLRQKAQMLSSRNHLTSRKIVSLSENFEYSKQELADSSSVSTRQKNIENAGFKPRRKLKLKRVFGCVGIVLFLLILGMILMFVRGLQSGQTNVNRQAAETEVFNGEDTIDGVNILILGTDGRIGDRSSDTRTDSIMVLNVGGKDKKLKLVSFMRDTLVHIDGVSYGDDYDQKLNVAYTIGEQENHQGAEFVREMLKDNFGLKIKYYALVDFSTFATAIDTLFPKGVEMNAKFSTIDGEEVSEVQVPDDLNMKDGVVPEQTIKVGKQQMDGRTLLNYARFRKDDEGDYGRTRRQQEVMSAIIRQIKDPTKLFTGSEAAGKVFALTSTNIPYSFLLTNGLGVITNAKNGMEKFTVPEIGDWVDAYDMYGGQALSIDFETYQDKLKQLGLR